MGRLFGWMAGIAGLLGAAGASAQPTLGVPKPEITAPATNPQPQPKPTAPADVALLPGPATVPVTGVFTLAFRLRGGILGEYSEFPELEGFKKSGKTSTTTIRTVQGRRFTDLTITQRYAPYGEGEFSIKPFQLTVNGVVMRSRAATVRVLPDPPAAAPSAPGTGPASPSVLTPPADPTAALQAVGDLDKLFGKPKPAQYQELPDGAFLAVLADQPSVYVGQGVRVGLYFFLKPSDQAMLAFHDFNEQLPPLLQELHQATAWQEPGPEASVTPDSVRQQGQLYLRFRLAENVYYPLTANPLRFPPLALTMVKYKFLKKPEAGQDNRLAGYKTYLAKGLTVAVRGLPSHPRQAAVAVGAYQLQETISRKVPLVGQAFAYTFGVQGKGNLAAVLAPELTAWPGLEVYGPEVREQATPGGGRKLFRYRLVARQPGIIPLDSLIHLVVFNPGTARYDTLRPAIRPRISGAVVTPKVLPKPAEDPFYGPALAEADARMQSLDVYRDVRRYASWLLIGLVGVAGVGWWRAGRAG